MSLTAHVVPLASISLPTTHVILPGISSPTGISLPTAHFTPPGISLPIEHFITHRTRGYTHKGHTHRRHTHRVYAQSDTLTKVYMEAIYIQYIHRATYIRSHVNAWHEEHIHKGASKGYIYKEIRSGIHKEVFWYKDDIEHNLEWKDPL